MQKKNVDVQNVGIAGDCSEAALALKTNRSNYTRYTEKTSNFH